MSRSRRKCLLDLALSPWTLFPVAGGWTLAIFFWAVQNNTRMAAFLVVLGVDLGLGMIASLWILGGSGLDPILAKLRQKFSETLALVRSGDQRVGCREAELSGTAAQAERV